MTECSCMQPPLDHGDFSSRHIGEDPGGGRFGEVTIETCRRCGRRWLHYRLEYEGFSRSGRWFRGLVSDEAVRAVTAETALEILEGLPWRLEGGSRFDSPGHRAFGALFLDP